MRRRPLAALIFALAASLLSARSPALTPSLAGPLPLKGSELGVGRRIPNLSFSDWKGNPHDLASLGSKGIVFAMTSASCPVSKRYLPSLARWSELLKAKGIPLVLVNPFPSERADQIEAQLQSAGLQILYVHDRNHQLTRALGATTTTEVFLLDAAQTLRYRGALDDQYGTDYSRERPSTCFLQDALTALLSNTPLKIEATSAPGCELDLPPLPQSPSGKPPIPPPTYHRDIARILQHHCVRCHRSEGIAPFALDELESVLDRAKTIRRVVSEGTMPPWHAAPPKSGPSPWANDGSLPERDRRDLLAWLNSPERPAGNPAEAPIPAAFPAQWTQGTPEAILRLTRSHSIPATGTLPYQIETLETSFSEDRWVRAYEIRPSAREVVHHVLIQIHEGPQRKAFPDGAESFWGAYVPGNEGRTYPPGVARKLPAGARLRFQIHYTPSGKPATNQLELGLCFAPQPPEYEVRTAGLAQRKLRIPPMAADHVETKSRFAPADLQILSLMPHLHTRGKSFQYTLQVPGQAPQTLLEIPRYDFNWQRAYEFKTPHRIPKGSELTITAHFDNSPANKANPDPHRTVTWGEQTSDEMMIGYLEYLLPPSNPTAPLR